MATLLKSNQQNTQKSKDISGIVGILTNQLVGEKCQAVRFSYGDELCLHYGELTNYDHPSLQELQKGSWCLRTRATPWILKQDLKILVDSEESETEDEIAIAKELVITVLTNQKLLKIATNPENLGLQLSFSEKLELLLQPDEEIDHDLDYWELFTPDEKVLKIGAGYNRSYKSIHDRN